MHQRTLTCPPALYKKRRTSWRSQSDMTDLQPSPGFGEGKDTQWGPKQTAYISAALVHAHKQLHPHGDAGVPAQWQQADVTGNDGWAQQVLHRGRAVRVPVEDLEREFTACKDTQKITFITMTHHSSLTLLLKGAKIYFLYGLFRLRIKRSLDFLCLFIN